MCGIAGIHYLSGAGAERRDTVKRMIDTLAHRGPDGEGVFCDERVGLGHRRLAIIDLVSGSQPMYRQNGELILVFNGEIYNYLELRDELRKKGHTFTSNSDSEVILAAYQQWGTQCVTRFNGMWAFAIWDVPNGRLFCSRDRAGEKPFYYSVHGDCLFFASEPKALFSGGVPRRLNTQHLDAYLCFGYVPAPDSFFVGVNKLPAGCNLIVEGGRIRQDRYWDIVFASDVGAHWKAEEVHERFAELFTDAVRLRMRSDVPFGAFLSGGLDSASVVSVMPSFSAKPISTFTIGFDEEAFDERALARLVAEKFGTNHIESIVSLQSGSRAIEFLAHFFDEPFGDSSALPTYLVSREARKYVSMVLTGDAGDEVLSGYPVHQSEKIATWLNSRNQLFRRAFIEMPLGIGLNIFRSKGTRLQHLYRLTQLPLTQRILEKQNCVGAALRSELLDSNQSNIVPAIEYVNRLVGGRSSDDTWNKLNYWLFKASLAEDMLVKVDRASMACSLETRIPFLDYRIVEFMASVPPRIKMPGLVRKAVLRKSIGRNLPPRLMRAPKKGFTAPESALNLLGNAAGDISQQLTSLTDSLPIKRRSLDRILRHPNSLSANGWWTLLMLSSVVRGSL